MTRCLAFPAWCAPGSSDSALKDANEKLRVLIRDA